MILHTSGFKRLAPLAVGLTLAVLPPCSAGGRHANAQAPGGFRQFIETLWPEAEAKGVSRRTFDAAFQGVALDLTAPDLVLPGKAPSEVKGQAEFTRTPAQYVNATYLARLADQGKALLVKHRQALEKIERELGVPRVGGAGHLGARDRFRRRTARRTMPSRRWPPRHFWAGARSCSATS